MARRVFASPLARASRQGGGHRSRRLSTGTGPHGRVVKADVEAAIAGGAEGRPPHAAGAAAACSRRSRRRRCRTTQVLKLFEPGSYEVVPHDNMRKIIARRLVEAKPTDPAFLPDARLRDSTRCWRCAQQINARAGEDDKDGESGLEGVGQRLGHQGAGDGAAAACRTPTSPGRKAACCSHKHSDVGVAVSIPGGLITPIVRQADDEDAVGDLQRDEGPGRARPRRGSSSRRNTRAARTAVSNLGMFGIKDFAAVINPPHATILAVGAGEERAVVQKGEIEVATIMIGDAVDRPSRGRRRARRPAPRRLRATSRTRRACWCRASRRRPLPPRSSSPAATSAALDTAPRSVRIKAARL